MSSLLSAEPQPPDASLTWHTASNADGVGSGWGTGVLTFQGKAYPFRIEEERFAKTTLKALTSLTGPSTRHQEIDHARDETGMTCVICRHARQVGV
jgi:hypothetical protein